MTAFGIALPPAERQIIRRFRATAVTDVVTFLSTRSNWRSSQHHSAKVNGQNIQLLRPAIRRASDVDNGE